MAYIRQLPSGRWNAIVRLPDGTRRSYTHPLRSVVKGWATEMEADRRRGELIDPRAGQTTVGELWEKVRNARRLELASRRRDESHWRVHVAPRWEHMPVGGILQTDVEAWIVAMDRAGVGAATIQGSVGVLRAILRHAVKDKLIRFNPAAKGELDGMPERPPHQDRVLEPDEDEPLLAALDAVAKGRPHGRLLGELMLYCGLRWSEAAAIPRERVLMRRQLLDIAPVVERDGTIRPYPKSKAGVRLVPVDPELWPRVRDRAMATPPGGLLIPAPSGAVLDYTHWRARVWQPAIAAAGLADPQPTPHDCRHTCGTRLAEQLVPLHEIMALMGHETLESVQRYLHASAARHDRARAAVLTGRGSKRGSRGSTSADIR